MRTIFTLFVFLFTTVSSFSQFVLSGTNGSINLANNAPATVVDASLTITGSGNLDGARVSLSANFSSGDVLSYTGSLPSGVTAAYNSTTGVLTFTGSASAASYQILLRTVKFNTTSTSALQRTVTFNLGLAIAFSANGHFYEFISGSFTWAQAKAAAAARSFYSMQGYLATITTQGENDFIYQKLGADGWIGASDDYLQINAATGATTYSNQTNAEGKWYWVTGPAGEKGTQFSKNNNHPSSVSSRFMNWNSGEPNNSNTEHYAEIYSTAAAGKWNDLGSSSLLGYVVEYGGLTTDPTVQLSSSRTIVMIATSLQTTGTKNPYVSKDAAKLIDDNIKVYSTGNITNAKVTIASNFKTGDALSFTGTLPAGVTSSYNASTGVLSFTGTATSAQWQAIFRNIKFYSTSGVLGDRIVTYSIGNLVAGSNGHFYEYVSTGASWTTAKTNASVRNYLGLNGYLATITTQDENDFIKQKLSADAWIGASDDYTQINAATGTSTFANQAAAESNWYWVTGPSNEKGTSFSTGNGTPAGVSNRFKNWNAGESNNAGGNEHYAQIYSSGSNPGKWNDLPNTSSLGYVVEYGGLDIDPMLQLSASRTVTITAILPVSGLQFNAEVKNADVQLGWSTLTEDNSDHFEILHSTDGINFRRAGEVAAAGSSNSTKYYQWKHTSPSNGINYYQLKQVDKDGRFVFSSVKQVNIGSVRFSLAPNPATSQITVKYNYTGKAAQLIIRNSVGLQVYTQVLQSVQTTVPVQQLSAGYYTAEVVEGTVRYSMQFVKQ
ncbi:MAG: lectin-like protein [Lacibacter sp.]